MASRSDEVAAVTRVYSGAQLGATAPTCIANLCMVRVTIELVHTVDIELIMVPMGYTYVCRPSGFVVENEVEIFILLVRNVVNTVIIPR